jgi:hypothetical protein
MSHVVGDVHPPGSAVMFLSESKIVRVLLSKFWVICVFSPSITQTPLFPWNFTLPTLHTHYDINTS